MELMLCKQASRLTSSTDEDGEVVDDQMKLSCKQAIITEFIK